ncbi:uncharacterized protein TM35_000231150 [Trypanosoma theileri]|uniref:Uncharacterized protein n=1 Tax=Trypanosoma theileri TaxID=67003 RepID=A0A1X0NR24_9TRYP|nr:uncharacterized protein TM35_000231150 [Trypanosoma theileri]ORC87144.1 hypothetical protein TM35_000231150 [Trypanosoma theileri]
MIAHDKIPRVSPPPAVRVPTLEPSTPSFITTGMLRSNLHEKQIHVSTLSDHYKPLQVNSARRPSFHRDPFEKTDATIIDSVHIEQVMDDIADSHTVPHTTTSTAPFSILPTTSPTATVTVEDFTQTSSLYQPMTTFSHKKTSDSQTQWSPSTTSKTPVVRPALSSTARSRRDVTPTRPAWNQNCPTPRAKPTVSTPQTEPRRLTREKSVEARSRPWRESVVRTNSTRSKLNTEIGSKINSTTSMSIPQPSRVDPTSARKTSPVGVTTSIRNNMARTTKDSATQKDKITLQARLDFLEKSLQDAQERAIRAEARCEELDISLQTLMQQHRDSTSRLEERNVQLHAQVQYMMQWMQDMDAKRVTRNTVSTNLLEKEEKYNDNDNEKGEDEDDDDEEEKNQILTTPEVLRTLSTSDDLIHSSSRMFMRLNSEGVERREMPVRSTAVRVPPSPPMMLQLQRQ